MLNELKDFIQNAKGITKGLKEDTITYLTKSFKPLLHKISFRHYMYCAGVSYLMVQKIFFHML